MSHYADYVRERTNKSIMEIDKGFATYSYWPDNKVYIEDIYIAPDFRKSNHASTLADAIAYEAKSRGCTRMVGSVIPSTKNSTTSLKVLLGYGMHLVSSSQDIIFFEKEI